MWNRGEENHGQKRNLKQRIRVREKEALRETHFAGTPKKWGQTHNRHDVILAEARRCFCVFWCLGGFRSAPEHEKYFLIFY